MNVALDCLAALAACTMFAGAAFAQAPRTFAVPGRD